VPSGPTGLGCGEGKTVFSFLENFAQHHKVDRIVAKAHTSNGYFHAALNLMFQKAGSLAGAADAGRGIRDQLKPVLHQHKLVVSDAHILEHDKGAKNLATEEIDRYRVLRQLPRILKDKGSLVDDNCIEALADNRTGHHIAHIELLAGTSRAVLRLG
jgi:hypothetical protein